MASSVGSGDATVHFLSDGGVITDQFNMRVLSIRQVNECGLEERITIEGLLKDDLGSRSYCTPRLTAKAVKVIYNPPATIAFWPDGSKTVVKCDKDDVYDPKYGLALCYMKKALGSSRAFNDALGAGREEEVRGFLKKHRYMECLLKDEYENVCPLADTPCIACPYLHRNLTHAQCVKLMREDIKKMMEGEKHD